MSTANLNWTVDYYEQNIDECNCILQSLENYNDIPLINYVPLQNFEDGALVRYRGMVQDMLNPEFYSSIYTVVNTQNNESYQKSGKFRDIPVCKAYEEFKNNEKDILPEERQVYFCIPIPCINEWVENSLKELSKFSSVVEKSSGLKREASDGYNEMEVDSENSTFITSPSDSKKHKTVQKSVETESKNNIHNVAKYFPFHEQNGLPCLIKIYGEEEKENFVLNNAIEVIGFLSMNPALEANWEDVNEEDKAVHPPPSLVPRIHAIGVKKLSHCNPLVKQITPKDVAEIAESARSDLHLIFTQLLFEDPVAADFLLCHLISRVYVRNEGHTIGKFSLNFYNIKHKNFGVYINEIIKMLVTNSLYLPLSLQFLNESCFTPKKDYESNRLWSGILQLNEGTHLILNETSMNEGQLNNQGCLNVLALQKVFREQEIQYDFGYYSVSYNTNIPLLVLSEGKSMFEADIKLKLKSDFAESTLTESYEGVRAYLKESIINKLRTYLTCVRLLDFELGEDMVKKIGEDYVIMRQQNEKVNSSDLHTLLVLSRLLALSYGRTTLTPLDWSRAVEMETERKSRSN